MLVLRKAATRYMPGDIPGTIFESIATPFTAVGIDSSRVFDNTFCWRTLCVSTSGDAPLTVMVSSSAPTFSSTLMGAIKPAASSMPSRRNALKPVSVNVTV